jgi:hypothetical protein
VFLDVVRGRARRADEVDVPEAREAS